MTPDELREAVARAMPEVLGPTHRLILADAALAVVREALRKPTKAMLRAAAEDEDGWRRMPYPEVRHALHWRAMLAASPLGDK